MECGAGVVMTSQAHRFIECMGGVGSCEEPGVIGCRPPTYEATYSAKVMCIVGEWFAKCKALDKNSFFKKTLFIYEKYKQSTRKLYKLRSIASTFVKLLKLTIVHVNVKYILATSLENILKL